MLRREHTLLWVPLAVITAVTALILAQMDGAHDARIAGNEIMAVAAVWGLGALGMALLDRDAGHDWLRGGVRATMAAALVLLAIGALLGNARWAAPLVRYFGYAGVLGSVWAGEYLLMRRDPGSDAGGLLSLTAVGVGFGVCAFEVTRLMAPAFALPQGQVPSLADLAYRQSTRVFWTVGVWGGYALLVMAAGVRIRSTAARVTATAMYGVALVYAALQVLTNPTADLGLRAGAALWLAGSALAAAALSGLTDGPRHPREAQVVKALRLGGLALTLLWAVVELV